jgi:Integrase core domain
VTDKELDRNAARRLAIIRHAQEVTGNVALTCRYYGISRQVFYRWLKGVVIDDTQLFNAKLQEWQDFYNYHRPHGALGGQTPYERLKQKTTATTPDVNDLRQSYTGSERGRHMGSTWAAHGCPLPTGEASGEAAC